VAVSGETGIVVTTSADLATQSFRLAEGLRDAGVGAGTRVALSGPNSMAWTVLALAVMASGAVLVPIDDLCDAPQFGAALASSNVQMLVATAARLDAAAGPICARGLWTFRLDGPATEVGCWRTLPHAEATPLPVPAPEDPLLLAWTSGTTGSPKIFALEMRNIASNVEAIAAVDTVGEGDRALLPLPLHHAYQLVVGMLSTLNVGTAIVLPAERPDRSFSRRCATVERLSSSACRASMRRSWRRWRRAWRRGGALHNWPGVPRSRRPADLAGLGWTWDGRCSCRSAAGLRLGCAC
jgi:long-chain acyl-CoA synthetase